MKIYASYNNTQFDKFIGKDVWVKSISQTLGHRDSYLKVLAIHKDRITYAAIPVSAVEGRHGLSGYFYWNIIQYLKNDYTEYVAEKSSVYDWVIHTPVTVYTSEELLEILEHCDVYEDYADDEED